MAKYRKKPIVIEAYQVRYFELLADAPQWFLDAIEGGIIVNENPLKIKTLEGPMLVSDGDYVIKGVEDEVYPCKPGIFEATYEKVDD